MSLTESIFDRLKRPYPYKQDLSELVKTSILYGLFVTFFLYIFRPFGIDSGPYNLFLVCLSYGGVTTFVVFVLNSNLNYLFSDYFCEEKWTVGREILWTIINISLIGIANAVLTSYLANISFSLKLILIFQLYTVLLALVPIVFVITYNEAVHNKKYSELSKDINSHLTTHSVAAKQVTIPSYNENEELEIGADDLVYITSADNYIEVYYKTTGENINKKLLRSTLKNTEAIFEDFQNIIRCHKSYIVNLNFVKNVTGNAQGYKLHLENSDIKIPVSRKLNDFVKEKLTT